MSNVQTIVARLGRKRIAERGDVTVQAVGNAVLSGLFPAHWYDFMENLCAEEGVECPRGAFKWQREKKSMPVRRRKKAGAA